MVRGKGHKSEINEVKRLIMLKEKNGHDATFERALLKSWATYTGWEYAGDALQSIPVATQRKIRRVNNTSIEMG